MYSILNKVDKHIKNNSIPAWTITFDKKLWPYYLNQAILYVIRRTSGAHFDKGCNEYTISYDRDGKIYFLARDGVDKTRLVVSDNGYANVDFKYWGVSEESIIELAHLFKYRNNDINSAKDVILSLPVSKLPKDRALCLYDAVDDIVNATSRELIADGEAPSDRVKMDNLLDRGVNDLINYIDYLYHRYLLDYPEVRETSKKRVRER